MDIDYYAVGDGWGTAELTLRKYGKLFTVIEFFVPKDKTVQQTVDESVDHIKSGELASSLDSIIVTYRGCDLNTSRVLGITGISEKEGVEVNGVKKGWRIVYKT